MARKKSNISKVETGVDICYDVPITIGYDMDRVVGHATFYKDRLPKNPNFELLLSKECKGDFDKNEVKEYQILQIALVETRIKDEKDR